MITYHISFRNEYSIGDGNYTLFRDTPTVGTADGREIPVWSNSYLARKVPLSGFWATDINNTPYAFCGTSPTEHLESGQMINPTGNKLVSTESNGSVVTLYNDNGLPAFEPEIRHEYCPPGSYGIMTRDGFGPNHKFVAGLSGVDSDGMPRPQATFRAEPKMQYYVRPNNKFFLGVFTSQPRELIGHPVQVAVIDFDSSPGQYHAIVVHKPDGRFEVKIVTQAVFALETAVVESGTAVPNAQMVQLKHQVKLMNSLIDAALGISVNDFGEARYMCSVEWANNPSLVDQARTALQLIASMKGLGYDVASVSAMPKLSIIFKRANSLPVLLVKAHWIGSIIGLPSELYRLLKNPEVEQMLSGSTSASQVETFELPAEAGLLPFPRWACSVEWRTAPPQSLRDDITGLLIARMVGRGYILQSKTDDGDKLTINFWRLGFADLETVTADWRASYDELPGLFKIWVTNPQVEPIFSTEASAQSQTSGVAVNGASVGTNMPLNGKYIGWLEWLEGPNDDTKADIIRQLKEALVRRSNNIGSVIDLADKYLMINFSHDLPWSLSQARADWMAAFDSVNEFQRNYIFGPKCEEDLEIKIPEIPSEPSYLGGLTWLEGPNEETKDSIIEQLKTALRALNNEPQEAINIGDLLVLPFAHSEPSSLADAKRDWLAAYNSIQGNQRMFISRPFCEKNRKVYIQAPDAMTNGTNGTIGVESNGTADPPVEPPRVEAPPLALSSSMSDNLAEKKRRALQLLEREGLVGISGFSVA